jgi:hypothetical protein
MPDIRQQIILEASVKGASQVDQLRGTIAVVEEQLDGWNKALEAGTTSTFAHQAATKRLEGVIDDLREKIVALRSEEGRAQRERIEGYAASERAAESLRRQKADAIAAEAQATRNFEMLLDRVSGAQQRVGESAAAAGRAAAGSGRGYASSGQAMLQLGYAIDDLQYGLKGIINNIPQVALSMGAGAGIAGVASIAAVAIELLAKNWDTLAAMFGTGKVRTEAEELDALAKATHRAADEEERFQNSVLPE